MALQTEILLKQINGGMYVVDVEEKSKHASVVAPDNTVNLIESAFQTGDPEEIGGLWAALYLIVVRMGWENAPAAYFLRHHGWAVAPAFGTAGDAQIIVRSKQHLNLGSYSAF